MTDDLLTFSLQRVIPHDSPLFLSLSLSLFLSFFLSFFHSFSLFGCSLLFYSVPVCTSGFFRFFSPFFLSLFFIPPPPPPPPPWRWKVSMFIHERPNREKFPAEEARHTSQRHLETNFWNQT